MREAFGRVVELREVGVIRRASGRCWVGNLVCATKRGELSVGHIEIDDRGRVKDDLKVDDLVEALRRADDTAFKAALPPASAISEDSFLDDGPADPLDELDQFLGALVEPDLRERVDRLLASGERSSLLEARELLPRLLTHRQGRGGVLEQMAQLEVKLGEVSLAVGYLEAAAREFADAADLESLARVAAASHGLVGEEVWLTSPTRELLEKVQEQQRPLENLGDAPVFMGLPPPALMALAQIAVDHNAAPGENLIAEGSEAHLAFVIRAGRVSVCLETPSGASRVVRCCKPGDMFGESSVLGELGTTCSATMRAEGQVRLWRFRGSDLRGLCRDFPELRKRLEAARSTHQLDSFFSMKEDSDALDARVRDGILAAVSGIKRVQPGELLIPSGKPPATVFLVVEGAAEHQAGEGSSGRFGRDTFVGLHDALHDLAVEGEYRAVEPSSLIGFDGRKLKELAAQAPPEVVAALERLR
ncbi:MAG: cyclic nucleotide-binding domain-containing protein [Myxococcales bacterium]